MVKYMKISQFDKRRGRRTVFFDKLKEKMTKTKESFSNNISSVFSAFTKVDEDLLEELLDVLIMSDVGMVTSEHIIDELRQRIKKKRISDPSEVKEELKNVLAELLTFEIEDIENDTVVMVVGVNGVGKTTTIGKLSHYFANKKYKVIACAADTFRAAAVEQLELWANKSNIKLIKKEEGADPASVIFDATTAMKEDKADILICDTAGRLHNKKNLMEELSKMNRVIDRELGKYKKEVLLILDATTGQNGIMQAKAFSEATGVTGIIVTKLDGTAKGGMIFSITKELNIPVRFIGLGEGIEDLELFDARKFVDSIF